MNKHLEEFFDMLVSTEKMSGNFQAEDIFHRVSETDKKNNIDMLFDFYHYLFVHDIIRYGLNTNNIMPYSKFTKYGRTLFENEARRIAMFEEFLRIYEYN